MDIQRLRNLTTGRLHTDIGHVYEDIATLTTHGGVMTHQIPNVLKAIRPWLAERLRGRSDEERFWDGAYDPSHVGDVLIEPMTKSESDEMLERFGKMKSPLFG